MQHIKGIANILADSVSKLRAVDLYHNLDFKDGQQELGTLFKPLHPVEQSTHAPIDVQDIFVKPDRENLMQNYDALQHMHGNTNENYFTDAMSILHKEVIDFNSTFSSVIVPGILIKYLLHASHDFLGHVGVTKLSHFLKRLYYFQGMQKIHQDIAKPHKITYQLT